MLLGGAMLAACSVEDDLNFTSATQEDNSSAPVFTVSVDNDFTRATMRDENADKGKWQLKFDGSDLLSLYHGAPAPTGTANPVLNNYENAIYASDDEMEGEGITFKTKAMVKEGLAVMVYPADTTFLSKGSNNLPVLQIPATQDKKTKELTPYMSEVLKIGGYSEPSTKNTAGYDKKYDISLKRVGSTLLLTLNRSALTLPADVADLKVKSVDLTATTEVEVTGTETGTETETETKGLLTTEIEINALKADPVKKTTTAHTTWAYQSTIGQAKKSEPTFNTKDVTEKATNKDLAIFTLLPSDGNEPTSANDVTGEIVVYTTYGKVVVNKQSGNNTWQKGQTAADVAAVKKQNDVSTGIFHLLTNTVLWAKTTETKSDFYKDADNREEVGGKIERTLEVNMANLNMDGLHITSSQELIDAIKVYNFLYDTDAKKNAHKVNFYLDGELNNKGENTKVFNMTKAAWTAAETKPSQITLHLCEENNDEKCEKVKLVGGDGGEVPALKFAVMKNGTGVPVELDGSWKYTVAAKDIQNVKTLSVLENATLKLDGATIGVKSGNMRTKIIVKKNGKVEIPTGREVVLNMSMNNEAEGKIIINKTARLAMGGTDNILTNEAPSSIATPNFEGGGVIENSGVLAILSSATRTEINNYGVIKMLTTAARTMVTRNATESNSLTDPFDKTNNAIGSIYLSGINAGEGSAEDNTNVLRENCKGFIKLKVENVEEVNAGNCGTIANYIIVGKSCKLIKGDINTKQNIKVKYLQIGSENEEDVVFERGKNFTILKALIVPASKIVTIPSETTVELGTSTTTTTGEGDAAVTTTTWTNGIVYVKAGTIYKPGKLNHYIVKSYFGGTAEDADRIFEM